MAKFYDDEALLIISGMSSATLIRHIGEGALVPIHGKKGRGYKRRWDPMMVRRAVLIMGLQRAGLPRREAFRIAQIYEDGSTDRGPGERLISMYFGINPNQRTDQHRIAELKEQGWDDACAKEIVERGCALSFAEYDKLRVRCFGV